MPLIAANEWQITTGSAVFDLNLADEVMALCSTESDVLL
jgi:hypothetical protein